METKVEKQKNSKIKLTLTLEADELVHAFKHSFDELAPTVKVPGFRPGKAPRKVVESSLGITRILSHAIDHAIQENYPKALMQEKIVPIAPPQIKIDKYPQYGLTAEEIKDPLEFTAEIEVFPEVEVGDYSKIKVEVPKLREPKKEDIGKVVEHLQKQRAVFSPAEREANKGDFAEISFEGSVKGVKMDQMTSKNHPVVLGENTLIPGFEDEVIGMKKGEEKTFKIKFPKDYHAKELAGKEAEFKVTLNELKEIQLPELNDDFAKKLGQETYAELEKSIGKSLQEEMEHEHQHELEQKVVDKLLPLVKVDVPEAFISQETHRMVHDLEERLKSQGMSFEGYLQSMKKDQAALEKEMRPQAEKNVKVGLLLGQVVRDQKMDENDRESGKKALDYLVKELTKK